MSRVTRSRVVRYVALAVLVAVCAGVAEETAEEVSRTYAVGELDEEVMKAVEDALLEAEKALEEIDEDSEHLRIFTQYRTTMFEAIHAYLEACVSFQEAFMEAYGEAFEKFEREVEAKPGKAKKAAAELKRTIEADPGSLEEAAAEFEKATQDFEQAMDEFESSVMTIEGIEAE